MIYKIISTDEMDKLLDNCVGYLLGKFENKQAAKHLLDGVSYIYDKLETNPDIYRLSDDPFMKAMNYHEAKISGMDYIIIYKIVGDKVYVLGIFHTLEDYSEKMKVLWNKFIP